MLRKSLFGGSAAPTLVAACLLFADPGTSQCGLQWQPGNVAGANEAVCDAIAWDPDGAGPGASVVVIAGYFQTIGTQPLSRIAAYDVAANQFQALGAGLNGMVRTVRVAPNNDLYAVGEFTRTGGVPAPGVARFDGQQWQAIDTNAPDGPVWDIAFAPNGDLYVVGEFAAIGAVPASRVARWDGSNWSALGSGVAAINPTPGVLPSARAVAVDTNGVVYIGGQFVQVGNAPAKGVARWNGSSWQAVGTGQAPGSPTVESLVFLPNGHLVAGGRFTGLDMTSVRNVGVWDGSVWSQMGSGNLPEGCASLTFRANGNLLSVGIDGMIEWNGSAWVSPVSGAQPTPMSAAVETSPGTFVAVGFFKTVDAVLAWHIAVHQGASWSPVVAAPAFDHYVSNLFVDPAGGLVAVGQFTRIGAMQVPGRARWDGLTWNPLPAPPTPATAPWFMVCGRLSNGDVVFQDGLVAPQFVAWDGSAWRILAPSGTSGVVFSSLKVTGLTNGDLVAYVAGLPGHAYAIGRWNGSAWSPLATTIDGAVQNMLGLSNGDLVISGSFTQVDGVPANGMARWSSGQWSAMGTGLAAFGTASFSSIVSIGEFVETPGGDLYALGASNGTTLNRWSGKWTGSGWQMLPATIGGGGGVGLPNGDLVVLGVAWLPGNPLVPMGGIARWDGSSWSPFGSGLSSSAHCAAVLPDDEVAVGGAFTLAGGLGSAYFARLASDCPATSIVTGSGCAGSAGPLTLQVIDLPWIGGVARGRCDGFANGALAVAILGLSPTNTLLSTLHPAGGAACRAWTTPDAVQFVPSQAGAAAVELVIPRDPAFVGVQLWQQFLQAEIDAFGGLVSLSSSNALTLTIGAL